jgi:hydrogenase expression/formation protein HypE
MAESPTYNFSSGPACPIPISDYPTVLLAHGGGGRLSQHLIQKLFLSQFQNPHLAPLHDGAILPVRAGRLAFSTDSYVIHPIFFPGGTIGELAVNGTVNDLAMCGARPQYLSVAFILEEGMPMGDLWRIVLTMRQAADAAGIMLVTGDTKVVERGKGDMVFITTSGIGMIPEDVEIGPERARPGDAIILSGFIADHGIAIMSVREGLEFETQITSDTAALNGLVEAMFSVSNAIHVLRDPTRGGVASALNEIAGTARVGMTLWEDSIPVREEVRGACELLGLDPLYVANEGKLLAIVDAASSERILEAMRAHPHARDAVIIGEVIDDHPGVVVMKSRIGGSRVVDMLSGEQLPRIC